MASKIEAGCLDFVEPHRTYLDSALVYGHNHQYNLRMSPAFELWMNDHMKGLHVRYSIGNAVYTSMFVRIKGKPYLLTAGHALEEIDNARKQNIKIHEATVLLTNGTEAFPIIDLESTPLYYLHEKDSIDIGLMPLRPWYENQIKDETFFVEENYSNLPSQYKGCLLIGFPAAFEQFESNFINLNPAYVSVQKTRRPKDLPAVKPVRFYGKIAAPGFSIKGMSGGPIMAFAGDESELRYWIIALQSGWYEKRQLICGTRLETSIPILLRHYGL